MLIGSVVLAACPASRASLTVRVQSGLRAGLEIRFVEASVLRGSVPCETSAGALEEGRGLEPSDQGTLSRGTITVAEFSGLEWGIYTVRVQARSPGIGGADSGAVLLERCIAVSVSGDRVIRVPLTSDCLGVVCPAAGGTAAFDQCLNGRCVDPRCDLDAPETAEYCCDRASLGELCSPAPTICSADTDCRPTASCSGGIRCERGACVEPDGDRCPPGEHCSVMQDRCVAEGPSGDAGTTDAGALDGGAEAPPDAARADASESDALSIDGAASPDANTDAPTPCTSVPRLLGPDNGAQTGSIHAARDATLRPVFRWEPTPDCEGYQLQVDDSCPTDASSCTFASPEIDQVGLSSTSFRSASPLAVSRTAPVGRRYHWRVRACNGGSCGAWSATRYLEVGRAPSDFNADGYADLVVGARSQDVGAIDEGAVFVYFGSPTGLPSSPAFSPDSPDHPVGGGFGLSVAVAADLDGGGSPAGRRRVRLRAEHCGRPERRRLRRSRRDSVATGRRGHQRGERVRLPRGSDRRTHVALDHAREPEPPGGGLVRLCAGVGRRRER